MDLTRRPTDSIPPRETRGPRHIAELMPSILAQYLDLPEVPQAESPAPARVLRLEGLSMTMPLAQAK